MAQDKVQLKREEVVGNDVVLQDINPKTKTNSITDSTKGLPLDQTLAMIKNMINNKLSRVVNSVNGRTGVVVLDAGDVGLSNVDNVSFGDIKRWVIEYMGDIFGTKRIILKEYLSEIHTITGTNDKAYADVPFYCEKGDAQTGDYMSYIGYIYWDSEHQMLKEEHLQIRVVGYTDRSLIYNTNVGDRKFSNGGLAVNIWKGEDALKVMNNVLSQTGYSGEELGESGLYIDKSKVVPDVYFFDGIYGTLVTTGENMRNQNGLVYWSTDPHDTTVGNLPIIKIFVNDVEVSKTATTGGVVETLHTPLNFKIGDIIISNFAYDQYINPDSGDNYIYHTYPKILDSLTCRQPGIGRVVQAADTDTNTPCIVKFNTLKPNVGRGLKLSNTNTSAGNPSDTDIELDILSMKNPRMNDGTMIYAGLDIDVNISGINAFDKYEKSGRYGDLGIDKKIYTVYPTGKSNNILAETNSHIGNNSMFILPNFSLCVIPGYALTQHEDLRPIVNWDGSSPIGDDVDAFGHNAKYKSSWNMLGINLEKMTWGGVDEDVNTHSLARNISGLRVNTDDSTLTDSWFGFDNQGEPAGIQHHSGGLSINVGDFLSIGNPEEISKTSAVDKSHYYDEGKVNVRINKLKGLYSSGENRLAVNIAEGHIYQPTNIEKQNTSLEGGLKFVPGGSLAPEHGLLGVNTGKNSTGLGIKNNFTTGVEYKDYGYTRLLSKENNVLAVQPYRFSEKSYMSDINESGIEIHNIITHEELASKFHINNLYTNKIWGSHSSLISDMEHDESKFNIYEIYVAGGNYYIYDKPNGQRAMIPYFTYYSDEDEYNAIRTAMETGVVPKYVYKKIKMIDPPSDWGSQGSYYSDDKGTVVVFTGEGTAERPYSPAYVPNRFYRRTEPDTIYSYDILRRLCHVLIKPMDQTTDPDKYNIKACIYTSGTTDLRIPDFNCNGTVDAADASDILTWFSKSMVSGTVYSDSNHRNFYVDEEMTTLLEPVEGSAYIDMNDYVEADDHKYRMMYEAINDGSGNIFLRKIHISGDHEVTHQDLINADVNRDGHVDGSDASHVLKFYVLTSTDKYGGLPLREAWRRYLIEYLGINVSESGSSVVDILDYVYEKGLRVRYNEMMGLTTMPNYIGGKVRAGYEIESSDVVNNSKKNMLAIKIADKSAGRYTFDSSVAGGLRFGSNGYLGVRVNYRDDNKDFQNLPTHSQNVEDMTVGTCGLRIYENNVLGVQLTVDGKRDNGELKIDSQGCLRLSGAIKPDVENLTITGKDASGNDKSVSYNGDVEIIIQLGEGLIFEE